MKVTQLLPLSFAILATLGCGSKEEKTSENASKPSEASQASQANQDPQSTGKEQCAVGLNISAKTSVMTINGVDVPCSELAYRTKNAILHAEAEFHEKVRDLQQQSLMELIDERLLENEMKGSNQELEVFIGSHVRAEPATEEEIQTVYAQALAAGEKLPAIEIVRSELESFINEQKQRSALEEFRGKLRAKAAIEVDMPILLPPQFDVEAIGNAKGPDTARVTIVEFSDFECGFCARAEPTIEKILNTYGDKVRLVYRDLPLQNHAKAPKAAEATHCAQEQGKYWEMHATLFENQRALNISDLKQYAGTLGLNQEQFDSCLDEGKTSAIVAASFSEASRLGINGTPAFFVNGRMLSGAQPFERFAELIDHELAR